MNVARTLCFAVALALAVGALAPTAVEARSNEEICDQECKTGFLKCVRKCKGGDYPACVQRCDEARGPCVDACLEKRSSGWLASPCATAADGSGGSASWWWLALPLAALAWRRRAPN